MAKTILITGGAGFVGSNILAYLFEKYPGYNYIVLDALTYSGDMRNIPEAIRGSSNFTFAKGDVRDAQLVNELVAVSDVVVHFAAETHVTRSIQEGAVFFETNVIGTECIANAVRHNPGRVERFIHISTSEVYGSAETELMDERHPLNPMSPYAASKVGADRLVYAYHATYRIPSTIVRPFNLFGLRQHPEKVIPRFITSRITGEPLTIHGTGGSRRDFMYVEDLARALDLIMHAPLQKVVGEVFNVGSGKGHEVRYVAELVQKMIPDGIGTATVAKSDRPGQVVSHAADATKIGRVLGWKPATVFEDGLKKVVVWYEANKEWWKDKLSMKQVPIEIEKGKTELQ